MSAGNDEDGHSVYFDLAIGVGEDESGRQQAGASHPPTTSCHTMKNTAIITSSLLYPFILPFPYLPHHTVLILP